MTPNMLTLCLFALYLAQFFYLIHSKCEDSVCPAFKTQDLPLSKTFPISADFNTDLQLVAAGMRRKSLFIVEVDVYKVGVYVSPAKDSEAQREAAVASLSLPCTGDVSSVSLGLVLHFVRHVPANKVVDAIVASLQGPGKEYNEALDKFSSSLLSSLGTGGAKAGEEVAFSFYGRDFLAIAVRGQFVTEVQSAALRERLGAIYLGEGGVVREVLQTLSLRYT